MLLSRLPATELRINAEPQPAPEAPSTRVPWHGGWAAMPHTATRSALPNNAYRVLGLLIGHMDLTTCEVHGYSAQRLARELGWSTRTVERALVTLRTMGWVSAYPDPAPYRLGWLVYVVRQEAPSELTATEQLLLDTGFHPTTARAFSGVDYDAVRGELHKQDLLAWLPREDRDRRIGMLVMRWRRVKPEVVREAEQSQETAATRYTLREEALAPVQDEREPLEMSEEAPLDTWTERARALRPQWTSEQQAALARALRHAPNDAAALVMAQVMLGKAQRC